MRQLFQRLRERLFGITITAGRIWIGERRGKVVMMSERDMQREEALDILEKHEIRAQFYMPATHAKTKELADALRLLAARGYIMTDSEGRLVGAVATARITAEEMAQERRASFKLVDGN